MFIFVMIKKEFYILQPGNSVVNLSDGQHSHSKGVGIIFLKLKTVFIFPMCPVYLNPSHPQNTLGL